MIPTSPLITKTFNRNDTAPAFRKNCQPENQQNSRTQTLRMPSPVISDWRDTPTKSIVTHNYLRKPTHHLGRMKSIELANQLPADETPSKYKQAERFSSTEDQPKPLLNATSVEQLVNDHGVVNNISNYA